MNKQSYIQELGPILKNQGYKKHGNYWYLSQGGAVLCINVQGSQWDKNDYYVNIGAAKEDSACKFPTILKWIWQHRCMGKEGELNLSIQDTLVCVDTYFSDYLQAKNPRDFYTKYKADYSGGQYWL